MTRVWLFTFLMVLAGGWALGQQSRFTKADTLRGSLRPERTCYDVTYYELDVELFPAQKEIAGQVTMHFDLLEKNEEIQIDLFRNMEIIAVWQNDKKIPFRRIHDAVFIDTKGLPKGKHSMRIQYNGQPRQGKMLPWDGGFSWTTDQEGNTWIAVACEGIGASLWWPNKDHLSDEPDSMKVICTVPDPLHCISNGDLVRKESLPGGRTRWHWKVSYPINNYNVTLNVGHYSHFSDTFRHENGDRLALDYYVMPYNLEKAKEHFKQVHAVLQAFEHYLGPYPYPRDGYALVETPYLGMEHQGAIAYGNRYQRGYLGGMQPRDMDQDYIILHETGHEYFGNWISCSDHAEMWIHESFTTYLESLYVEYHMGRKPALRYLNYQRPFIRNSAPIVGPMGVNYQDWGSSDIYYKGAWVLQTLREAVQDDEQWFEMLKGMVRDLGNKVVTSEQVCNYMDDHLEGTWDYFFDQYLHNKDIPTLLWREVDGRVSIRWDADVDSFAMPVRLAPEVAIQPVTDLWIAIPEGLEWNRSVMEDLRSRYLFEIKRTEK